VTTWKQTIAQEGDTQNHNNTYTAHNCHVLVQEQQIRINFFICIHQSLH